MIETIKAYAKAHQIPILSDDGLLFLKETAQKYAVKDVLEIGSAIGYSAIAMALFGCQVDTIERNELMYQEIIKNIASINAEDRIHPIFADAITYEGIHKTYDMIFIDAAKSQYKLLFNKYQAFLKPHGIIVCDNLHFHHLDPNKVNRNTKQLLRKLHEFIEFLKTNDHFDTQFFDVGDGMSISKRRLTCD